MKTKRSQGSYPTLKTIAESIGISRSSVAEILNGNERYSDDTRAKVHDAVRRLNYQPDRSAQMMRRGRSNLIGVMHNGGPLQVTNERAKYLGHFIMASGYQLWLADALWTPTDLQTRLDTLFAARVEGFVFSGPAVIDSSTNLDILNHFVEAGIPIVAVSSARAPGVSTVNSDFEDGFYQLGRHLIERGRRRITLLLSHPAEESWHGVQRRAGVVRAIQEAGGTVRESVDLENYRPRWQGNDLQAEVIYTKRRASEDFGVFEVPMYAMEKLLDRGFTTDGLMASNDDWAAGVVSVCLRRGVDVPRQMAVTGFDNSAVTRLSPVPITSASQQTEEACRLAVELLLQRMQGKETQDRDITIPCPIIVRASSGGGVGTSAISVQT